MPAPIAAAAAAVAKSLAERRKRRGKGPILGAIGGVLVLVVVAAAGLGGGVAALMDCESGGGDQPVDVGPVTPQAKRDIPAKSDGRTISIGTYKRLGDKLDIDWHFVASIGAQESNHGRSVASRAVNYAGCQGPMQLGVGGACGDFFGTYKKDGDGDGKTSPLDPEDAVATAINGLKKGKGAPGKGGSYQQYRQAACGYYGACADGSANYADEVMARAVAYGFKGPGAPKGGIQDTVESNAAPVQTGGDGGKQGCGDPGGEDATGPAELKKSVTLRSPRKFKAIPQKFMAFGAPQPVDSRIYPNVIYVLRKYKLKITAARESGHATHGDGTAIDAVPATGNAQSAWDKTALRLAEDLGWKESCGGNGMRPVCDLVPAIKFIGYEGYPSHGSPKTCSGGCPAHIHVSWESDTYGTGPEGPPPGFVKVFPSPGSAGGGDEEGGGDA